MRNAVVKLGKRIFWYSWGIRVCFNLPDGFPRALLLFAITMTTMLLSLTVFVAVLVAREGSYACALMLVIGFAGYIILGEVTRSGTRKFNVLV